MLAKCLIEARFTLTFEIIKSFYFCNLNLQLALDNEDNNDTARQSHVTFIVVML